MKKLIVSSLIISITFACFASSKPDPLYLDIGKAIESSETKSLQDVIKVSYKIARKMGRSFVCYWEPKNGTNFIDITPKVVAELSKIKGNKNEEKHSGSTGS